MKLISAEEAFRILSDYYHHRTAVQAYALIDALDRVPEAVVRCIDCKHMGYPNARGAYGCKHSRAMVDALINGYCSYGERRSDETIRE